jgi:hypothetical protein
MRSARGKITRLNFENSLIDSTFRLLITEDVPVVITMAMFVIFLVGFLVGTYVIALIAKFIGGALKPSLPSLEAPVRKVVVRRRTIQVGSGDDSRDQNVLPNSYNQPASQAKPRPKVVESSLAG